MRIRRWIFVAVVAGTGCAHQPCAYVFTNTKPADANTVIFLAGTLEHQGHQVAAIERDKGEILTCWEDTRYRFHDTDDLEDETIFLRYHIQIRPGDNQVSVTSEAQRCVQFGAIITRMEVRSECYQMTYIFGTQQRATERLGQGLAASLGGTG